MPWVMVVAPPDAFRDQGPAPEAVRAFLVGGEQGILLWKDTWHAFNRFPAAPPGASFALLTGADTQAELEERMVRRRAAHAHPRGRIMPNARG